MAFLPQRFSSGAWDLQAPPTTHDEPAGNRSGARLRPALICGHSIPLARRVPLDLLTNPAFMAVAVIGVCLLGISKGGFRGLVVMALPLMSLFVPPLQAAAIILPTAVAQDCLTLWIYRREWSAWNIKIMLPSMFVGMICAWLVAASLSAAQIRLAIGLIATLFVVRHWTAKRFEKWLPKPSVATGIIFGAIGGFTTMLANAGGPAWQIHLLPPRIE